jgi:hypothetical protein
MTFFWETQAFNARSSATAIDSSTSSTLQLAGNRALAVARLISLAPARARLTPQSASALLAAHAWSLRATVTAVTAEIAASDPSAALTPPNVRAGLRNLHHAGNTCYLASVLAALFAGWDAWDGLLDARAPASTARLRAAVREVVGRLRRGESVSAAAVEAVRGAVRLAGFQTGTDQEDAADLFVFLVDALGAPYLPMGELLLHTSQGERDADDERVVSERLLWLSVPTEPACPLSKLWHSSSLCLDSAAATLDFSSLVAEYFLGDRLEGLKRNGENVVDAWKARRILPWYTPLRETGEVAAVNDAAAFCAFPVPMALKRYDHIGGKTRTPINIPSATRLDFSDFVDGVAVGSYSLVLRAVVCHLGHSLDSGHYIAYTYHPPFGGAQEAGWRRWNDLDGGQPVQFIPDGQLDSRALDELTRDSYLVFYELVEGDGTADPRDAFFLVRDVDVTAIEEDDQHFAQALQRIEFQEFVSAQHQCHMQ